MVLERALLFPESAGVMPLLSPSNRSERLESTFFLKAWFMKRARNTRPGIEFQITQTKTVSFRCHPCISSGLIKLTPTRPMIQEIPI